MVLTLYGASGATCTKRVATILHEKQVPFKFVAIDMAKQEHKSPAYLEKQPFGQVPYIVSPATSSDCAMLTWRRCHPGR